MPHVTATVPKMRFVGNNASLTLMLRFTPYETKWLLLSEVIVSLHYLLSCHRCLRSTVTCGKTSTAVTFSKVNLCCHVIVTQDRPTLEQSTLTFYNLTAGNGEDIVNCKLITARHQNSEPRVVCGVIVTLANKTVMARLKSVKLPTSGFGKFFILNSPISSKCLFPPPPPTPMASGSPTVASGPVSAKFICLDKTSVATLELLVKRSLHKTGANPGGYWDDRPT